MRRFWHSMRHEGLSAALDKARIYLRVRAGQGAPSALSSDGTGDAQTDETYLHGIWRHLAREEAFDVPQQPAVHQKRRQIAMIGDLNLPQCRKYRVEQLAQFWRSRDVGFEFAHFQDVPRATRILQHATHVMEYRLQTLPVTEMLRYEVRRLRLPVLYDLDDPLFSVSAYETYGNMTALDPALKAHFIAQAPLYLSMMNGADVVSVSTPGMAALAGQLSNRQIMLRRNFADEETLSEGQAAMGERREPDGSFRVALASGSQGHEADFQEIAGPLSAFLQRDQSRRLLVLGHFDLNHLPADIRDQVETVPFQTYPRYLAALAQADCAVMPLCDDAFNRCKSAVRVIDASAVGVPSVVSPVGDLPTVVADGESGFVAGSDADWSERLEQLAGDASLTQDMGARARQLIETRWAGCEERHIVDPALMAWVRE